MATGETNSLNKHVKYCLRLLSISPRTESELKVKLRAKGCGGADTSRILAFLRKERFVDDLAFAREWIASRMRSNPRGREAIEHELRKKGVPAPTVAEAFSGMKETFDENELARRLGRKKLGESSMRKGPNVRGRLYRFLASKGFSEDTVEEVVRELLGDEE